MMNCSTWCWHLNGYTLAKVEVMPVWVRTGPRKGLPKKYLPCDLAPSSREPGVITGILEIDIFFNCRVVVKRKVASYPGGCMPSRGALHVLGKRSLPAWQSSLISLTARTGFSLYSRGHLLHTKDRQRDCYRIASSSEPQVREKSLRDSVWN